MFPQKVCVNCEQRYFKTHLSKFSTKLQKNVKRFLLISPRIFEQLINTELGH